MPDHLGWASTIGLFIINFGALDLHVQDYLENNLPPEEFSQIKGRPFYERVERIKAHVRQAGNEPEKRQARDEFFIRLEPVRELRNHIAHGRLHMTLSEDKQTRLITLSLPRDLAGTNSPEARHFKFDELLKTSTSLTDLSEDFMRLFGNWVVDAEIRF